LFRYAFIGFSALTYCHSQNWPREGIDLKDKRIAVIGTGASGVQTIQECAQGAKQLTVFQRTPNLALPMNQRVTDAEDVERKKREGYYEATFKLCYNTFGGLAYQFHDKNTFDDTPEERKQLFEDLLIQKGGFNFMAGAYKDLMTDERANREVSCPTLRARASVHKNLT
jgi:cation diffusion facilitator CzcD-associated flavoprotein CzcO